MVKNWPNVLDLGQIFLLNSCGKRSIAVFFSACLWIERRPDSKEHPECRYSSSTAKECSSNNGKYTCETIRRIFKSCPNTRPEKIYEKTTTDSGTDDNSPAKGGGFLGGWGDHKLPGAESVSFDTLHCYTILRLFTTYCSIRGALEMASSFRRPPVFFRSRGASLSPNLWCGCGGSQTNKKQVKMFRIDTMSRISIFSSIDLCIG